MYTQSYMEYITYGTFNSMEYKLAKIAHNWCANVPRAPFHLFPARYWDSLLYVLYENGGRPPNDLKAQVGSE